jgi:hypothetical protein
MRELSNTYVSDSHIFHVIGKEDDGMLRTKNVLGVRESVEDVTLDLKNRLVWNVEFWDTYREIE